MSSRYEACGRGSCNCRCWWRGGRWIDARCICCEPLFNHGFQRCECAGEQRVCLACCPHFIRSGRPAIARAELLLPGHRGVAGGGIHVSQQQQLLLLLLLRCVVQLD